MATDPVCGMDVIEAQAPAQTEYQGERYYFCSEWCKEEFDKDPERYARATQEQSDQMP
jgi:YHS domain-containing protein